MRSKSRATCVFTSIVIFKSSKKIHQSQYILRGKGRGKRREKGRERRWRWKETAKRKEGKQGMEKRKVAGMDDGVGKHREKEENK